MSRPENQNQRQQDPYYVNNPHRTPRARALGALGTTGIIISTAYLSGYPLIEDVALNTGLFVGSFATFALTLAETASLLLDSATSALSGIRRVILSPFSPNPERNYRVAPEEEVEQKRLAEYENPLSPIPEVRNRNPLSPSTPDSYRSIGSTIPEPATPSPSILQRRGEASTEKPQTPSNTTSR